MKYLLIILITLFSFNVEAKTLKSEGIMLQKYVKEFYNNFNLKFKGIIRYSTYSCTGLPYEDNVIVWGDACLDTKIIHINPIILQQPEEFIWAVVMHEIAHTFGVNHTEETYVSDQLGPMLFYDKEGYNYIGRYCQDNVMNTFNEPDELVPCIKHEYLGKDYYRSTLGDLLMEVGHKIWHESNNTTLEAQ